MQTPETVLTKNATSAVSDIEIGDIFVLGDHRLACGDASDGTLVSRLLWAEKIALLLTDPPYGIDYVASKRGFSESTTKHDDIENDAVTDDETYARFTESWLTTTIPHLADHNAVYIFNSDKMVFALREAMWRTNIKFSQLLVWIKDSAVIGRLDYLPQHELIAYGWYGRHRYRGSKSKSVIFCPKTRKNTLHPTMKPIPLLRELILNGSETSDIVYNPFGGSGSTLIACEQTKRTCRLIEIDPIYCQRIIRRWETLTGRRAEKISFSQ